MNEETKPPSTEPGSGSWIRDLGRRLSGPLRDRDELSEVFQEAADNELIESDVLWMLEGVLGVSDTQVRDIMIPRGQMVVVERDDDLDEILRAVVESGHSRFPVIADNRDEVEGLLLAKDLLKIALSRLQHPEQTFDIRDLLRKAVFVPESKRLNVLLKEFRASRNHIAIVVDEYGGVAGLVTIEDVLEQIVGEIDDEYDRAEAAFILKQEKHRYLVKGLTPIEEFNRFFQTEFEDDEFDTIGGYVTHAFGHMPRRGESMTLGRYRFNVHRSDSRRIQLFLVNVLPEVVQDAS